MKKCPNCGFDLNYSFAFKKIRNDYPMAFQIWSPEENTKLAQLVKEGNDINTISTILGRHPTSIRKRMSVLGLEIKEGVPVAPAEDPYKDLTVAEPFVKQ